MAKKLLKSLFVLFAVVAAAGVGGVHAIHDPTYVGIKTKTHRRDPQIALAFDQQQQHHISTSHNYHTSNLDGTERLSPIYNNNNNIENQHHYQQQQQEQPQQQQQYQGDYYIQQQLPLYERNNRGSSNSNYQERHAAPSSDSAQQPPWNDAEHVITEYYTGCPPQHTGPVPYAYDCRRFVNCWHGRGHIQSCAPGTVFNPETLECDRPDKVVCGTLSALGAASQQLQTSTRSSVKYRSGRLSDSITENVNTMCPPGVTGLHPHPHDCTKFLNCANGNVHIQDCGPGTAYSISMMVCDFKEKVDCSGREGGSGGGDGGGGGGDVVGAYSTTYNQHNSYDNNGRESQSHSHSGAHGGQWRQPEHNAQGSSWTSQQNAQPQIYGQYQPVSPGPYNVPGYSSQQQGHYIKGSYSGNAVTTTQTPQTAGYGDRWSNMNMQRPDGNTASYGAQTHTSAYGSSSTGTSSSTWSGVGSSIDRQTPSQSVIYEEGSLQPNRNYAHSVQSYSTPLAPFTSNNNKVVADRSTATSSTSPTTNIYYAQPVGSQEDSEELFNNVASSNLPSNRHNHSREINYSSTLNAWTPTLDSSSPRTYSHSVNIPNQSLMPPYPTSAQNSVNQLGTTNSRTINTPVTHHKHYLMAPPQIPQEGFGGGQRETADFDQSPGGTINTPVTHLMPPPRTANHDPRPPPSSSDHGQRPQEEFGGGQRVTADFDQSPGGTINTHVTHLMPPPRTSDHDPRPLKESDGGQRDISDFDLFPSRTNKSSTLAVDITNLYGGLQPPPSSASPTHPTAPTQFKYHNHNPTYTPITSDDSNFLDRTSTVRTSTSRTYVNPTILPTNSITPSRTNTDQQTNVRVFQIYPPVTNVSDPRFWDPHYSSPYASVAHSRSSTRSPNYDEVKSTYLNNNNLLATTEHRGASPPPYNREYYQPESYSRPNDEVSSVNEDNANDLPISDAIRMLLRPYFNRSGTVSEDEAEKAESHIMRLVPTTTPKTVSIAGQQHDGDVELILAGEQHSLTTIPTQDGTRKVSTEFHSRQQEIETQANSNWHTPGHNKDFHVRHPNLPNPFTEDERSSADPKHNTNTQNHHHHHRHDHHSHGQHSREFHLRHPNLPDLFATKDEEKSVARTDVYDTPNPNAEPTTPNSFVDINIRSSALDNQCQFDCGTGKCVKAFEVCDGVNNCGNRKDEEKCEHLGYEIRLTGGDSSNMGRVEVKILGKWGYVCDDKFGLRDADVVCRELGFNLGASEVRGNSYYPPSEINFSFVMDEVDCGGNESSIKDCNFKGWGVNNCGPDEVVGVVCKVPLLKCPNNYWLCSTSKECIPPAFVCDNTPDCADKSDESVQVCNSPIEYRLEGGRSPNEGRLEVRYRREWGTVCDDDFGLKEAQVLCNSLEYYGKPKIEKNIYGPGSGPIWLDQVSCFGNETSIDKCNHWTWGEHNCNHTEDVGIKCTAGPPPRRAQNYGSSTDYGQQQVEEDQTALEDIGLYSGRWQRSSKAITIDTQRRCGHFTKNLLDEYAHPEERVVNGTIAKRGRHPWQATIRTRGRGGISSHWCGAVLISKRHLLTAAHCLAGYPKGAYFIRMGDHYANIAESSEVDSYIENWYIHDNFRDETHMNNDIALIVLKTPVHFNDYVQPVCLPEKGASLEENRMCTISGWGSIKSGVSTPSNILRAAQLPILKDATCKQSHVYGASMTEGMFCAGFMDESVDACDGDSGGPLICSDDDGETLYGIISWGQHCGYANKPGVYVRVAKYIDWIYEKINFSIQQPGR